MIRIAPLTLGIMLAGCGPLSPPADMPARSWRYYAAHPAEIEPMQAICRQWSESGRPAGSEPAVITGNCRAAAFAKTMRRSQPAP
jgi:hypothetical protein